MAAAILEVIANMRERDGDAWLIYLHGTADPWAAGWRAYGRTLQRVRDGGRAVGGMGYFR